jgi:hypothetical protein
MKHQSNTNQAELGTYMGKRHARSIGVMAGKRTGFSRLETTSTRLFPYKSTQAVDFPHLSWVSVFSGEQLTAETQRRGDKPSSNVDMRNGASEGGWRRVLAKNGCAQLHVFTRIYTLLHNVPGGNVTRAEIEGSEQQAGKICLFWCYVMRRDRGVRLG